MQKNSNFFQIVHIPKHVDEDNFVFSKLNSRRIKQNSMEARLVATLQAAQSIVRFTLFFRCAVRFP